ncbi:MAG: VOC family protein [Actinomycetota bacterium]|nr:VOC family protein [Actinomycetota bacterium]
MQLGSIRQTAYVTRDIEKEASHWVDFHGIGPWFLYEIDIANSTYRGNTARMRARMGLAQSGSQQIELIQPADEPSIYTEFLDSGSTGIHHVCYWANISAARDHFLTLGSVEAQHGVTSNGNEFLYMTGTDDIPFVEVVDPNEAMHAFFALVENSAANWDGIDPIRSL